MKSKKPTKKELREREEIGWIEATLRDLAQGAMGAYQVDDEAGLIGAFGSAELGNFLGAVECRYQLNNHAEDDATWNLKHALDFSRFEHLDSFEKLARWLHSQGVRE